MRDKCRITELAEQHHLVKPNSTTFLPHRIERYNFKIFDLEEYLLYL